MKMMTIKTTTVTTTITIKTILVPDDISDLFNPTDALKRNLSAKDGHDEPLSALAVPALQ